MFAKLFSATLGVALFWLFIIIPVFNSPILSRVLIDFVFAGIIPGTNIAISFEAFAAGAIFMVWLIATYGFTLKSVTLIKQNVKSTKPSRSKIKEIAL